VIYDRSKEMKRKKVELSFESLRSNKRMAKKFIIFSSACCLAVAAFLLGADFGASRQEIDDERAQKIVDEFWKQEGIFDWEWERIKTLCEKGIDANSKKILPLYKRIFR